MNAVVLASALFALGLYGMLSRRDLVAVLASVEVMLGGANVLLVAVATSYRFAVTGGSASPAATGVFTAAAGLIVLVLAAAEASVGLALLAALVRAGRSRTEEIEELAG